jgi:hypothetical protein
MARHPRPVVPSTALSIPPDVVRKLPLKFWERLALFFYDLSLKAWRAVPGIVPEILLGQVALSKAGRAPNSRDKDGLTSQTRRRTQ